MARKSKNNLINKRESKIMLAMTGILLAVVGTVLVLTGQISTLNIMGDSTSGSYYSCPSNYTENGVSVTYAKNGASTCRKTSYYIAPTKCPSGYTEKDGRCERMGCDLSKGFSEYEGKCRKRTGTTMKCPDGYTETQKGLKECKKTTKQPYCADPAMKLVKSSTNSYYCKKGKYTCPSGYTMKQIKKTSGSDYEYRCYEKQKKYKCNLGSYDSKKYRVVTSGSGSNTRCLIEKYNNMPCAYNNSVLFEIKDKHYVCKSKNKPKNNKCPEGWSLSQDKSFCYKNYQIKTTFVKEVKPTIYNEEVYKEKANYSSSTAAVKYKEKIFYANKKNVITYSYQNKIKQFAKKEAYCTSPYYKALYETVYCQKEETVNAIYHKGSNQNSPKIGCSTCDKRNTSAYQACMKNCDKNR